MDTNRVSVRYAKALIELAQEQNVLDQVDRDLRILNTALKEYAGFAFFISNPTNSSSDKLEKVKAIFSGRFHELSMKFIDLVFKNKREAYLTDLCRNALELSRKARGVFMAELLFAKEVKENFSTEIKKKFETRLDATLEMTTSTDPALMGGFVFTIDGLQYDASIASQLKKIKSQLQL